MDLKYDLLEEDPRDPRFVLRIEFDEIELRFYVVDDSDRAAEAGDSKWTDLGEWREASLWLARQLLSIGMPVGHLFIGEEIVGGPADGARPATPTGGSPSRAARDLSDDETLRLLGDPPHPLYGLA